MAKLLSSPGRTSALEIHHFVEAAGIVAFGVVFYSYSFQWFGAASGPPALSRRLLNGLAFGLVTVGLMIARMQLSEGLFIDARAVPLALIGLFEGGPAAAVAAVPPIVYRVWWLGGPGATAGVAGVITFAALGTLAHVWAERSGGVTLRHALALSVAAFVATFLSFVGAGPYGISLFGRVWLATLVTDIVGIGVVARLFRDVGDRMRLMGAQERFRTIIDEASDAIRIVDADTLKILDVNRTDCELSGYRREEIIGRDVRDFWPSDPEQRAQRQATITTARAEGFARAFSQPYLTRTGTLLRVDSTRRIVEHRGRRYEIVIYRDASQREAAEAASREVAELRAVNLVAGGAAHEINNPLAVIVGSLGLLERRMSGDAPERKWTEQALEASRRIHEIVTRMTKITRVERTESEHLPPILDIRKSSEITRAEAP